jgi:hypothetical protein
LKPFCGQNIVIAVLYIVIQQHLSADGIRTNSIKKSHRCSRLAPMTDYLSKGWFPTTTTTTLWGWLKLSCYDWELQETALWKDPKYVRRSYLYAQGVHIGIWYILMVLWFRGPARWNLFVLKNRDNFRF